jgi:hypothetical protein
VSVVMALSIVPCHGDCLSRDGMRQKFRFLVSPR